jgi:molecular chaperone DnaK (HSP70)
MPSGRYGIGIDLGTSTCALAYVDLTENRGRPQTLPIPQWETATQWNDSATLLPSFIYLCPPAMPWTLPVPFRFPIEDRGAFSVGISARALSATLPGRVIHSAKSWLTHSAVDRQAALLPWGSDEIPPAARWSPVEVSAIYLSYLKQTWDLRFAAGQDPQPFNEQAITITVPASFDEVAQTLALEACALAGYPKQIRLLEEPQAAFYCWLENKNIAQTLTGLSTHSKTVLVCDVGGGTTDFSLFEVAPPLSSGQPPQISRIAVSDHLLLGGDNLDLAIAHYAEKKLKAAGHSLDLKSWKHLVSLCRALKEKLLSDDVSDSEPIYVSIPGSGSQLFKQSLTCELTPREVRQLIEEGFFPPAGRHDRARHVTGGLKELGLPFASDTAITKHLAEFLAGRNIDCILFNGGTLKPAFLQQRLISVVTQWQPANPLQLLQNPNLELAVAKGAAAYSREATQSSLKIQGGYPHSIFLELASLDSVAAPKLICILPKGSEPGTWIRLSELRLKLLLNKPIRFQIFSSNRVNRFSAGEIIDFDSVRLKPLPPLQTEIKGDGKTSVEIRVESSIAETGLLQVYCTEAEAENPNRWPLHFNLRSAAEDTATETENGEASPNPNLEAARKQIDFFFGTRKLKENDLTHPVKNLRYDLEKRLGPKEQWNLFLLRSLWPSLNPGVNTRRRSAAHESTWLYLAGYCLRPGYGADLDPWRISEVWKCFSAGMAFPKEKAVNLQWWILWRRIAGGLDHERQTEIADRLFSALRARNITAEMLLLLGYLEKISIDEKIRAGQLIVKQLQDGKGSDPHLAALGRISSRLPLYAGAESVIPANLMQAWIEAMIELNPRFPNLQFFLLQASRKTNDRTLNISEAIADRALEFLRAAGTREELLRGVREWVALSKSEREIRLGEDFPAGLQLL